MNYDYRIPSTDEVLYQRAWVAAENFVQNLDMSHVVGVSFIGALARGYFDRHADIDIVVYYSDDYDGQTGNAYSELDGFNIECTRLVLSQDSAREWDFPRRQAYCVSKIVHDPQGRVAALYGEKLQADPQEMKRKLIPELVFGEWAATEQTDSWIERGDIFSAHKMLDNSLRHLVNALYLLDEKFIPDEKWYYYFLPQLTCMDREFIADIKKLWTSGQLTPRSIRGRQRKIKALIQKVIPLAEQYTGLDFDRMKEMV